MYTAILDTNVLWPSLQRNFILSLAAEGVFRAVWNHVIQDELEYEVERKWRLIHNRSHHESLEYARKLREEMDKAFPDALIRGWENLEGTFGLPDVNDEHVLAAAVVAQASIIVTSNMRDFPDNRLPSGVSAISPQEFVRNVCDVDSRQVVIALQRMAARSGRVGPLQTTQEIAAELNARYDMSCVAQLFTGL